MEVYPYALLDYVSCIYLSDNAVFVGMSLACSNQVNRILRTDKIKIHSQPSPNRKRTETACNVENYKGWANMFVNS